MLLKRIYENNGARCVGVQLRHTGIHAEQNFSQRIVFAGMGEGWLAIAGDMLTLHTDVGDLKYKVKREPGYYSCHDGKRIPISALAEKERSQTGQGKLAAAEARAYLAVAGVAGKPSPNKANPSGYEVIDHWECVLDGTQHAKYKAIPGPLAPSMRAAK
jgi:hypothetical protein